MVSEVNSAQLCWIKVAWQCLNNVAILCLIWSKCFLVVALGAGRWSCVKLSRELVLVWDFGQLGNVTVPKMFIAWCTGVMHLATTMLTATTTATATSTTTIATSAATMATSTDTMAEPVARDGLWLVACNFQDLMRG